jgi:hypothetical protein
MFNGALGFSFKMFLVAMVAVFGLMFVAASLSGGALDLVTILEMLP